MTGIDEKGMVNLRKEVVYLSPQTAASPGLLTQLFGIKANIEPLIHANKHRPKAGIGARSQGPQRRLARRPPPARLAAISDD